ncbi:MAG: hypothetical protein WCK90_00100 [archaeon]
MKNEISTIQLRANVKNDLDRMREKSNESYEDVIVRMIQTIESKRRAQEDLMIEGCKVMAEDMLEINREWEQTDAELDWEWKDDGDKKGRHSSR